MINLQWGLRDVIPDDAVGAIGARLIVTQDGHVDFLGDRADTYGDITGLEAGFPLAVLRKVVASKLVHREINTREDRQVTLIEDGNITFVANANASAGYLYISGWVAP